MRLKRLNSRQQRAILADLATWLEDGVAPNHACEVMLAGAKEQKQWPECMAFEGMLSALAEGKSLAHGMQKHFHPAVVRLFALGQQAGCLADVLLAQQQRSSKLQSMQKAIWKPLVYPLLMLMLAILAMAVIANNMMPRLESALPVQSWPLLSQLLATSGQWLFTWAVPLLLVVIGCILIFAWALPNWTGTKRTALDNYKPWRWYRDIVAADFITMLALLLRSHCSLAKALAFIGNNASGYLHSHVEVFQQRLQAGEVQWQRVFASGLFSRSTLFRLQVGSSGQDPSHYATLFDRVGERLMNDFQRQMSWQQRGLLAAIYGLIMTAIGLLMMGLGALMMAITQQAL